MSPRGSRAPQATTLPLHLGEPLHRKPLDETLALIFPGQGSHQVGAGRDLFDTYRSAREVFQRCDKVLGFSITRLCFEGPEEQLRDTANAQPAILAASLACLAAGLESGVLDRRPAFVAGHSLGEFSALVAAGALNLEDALPLVAARGQLMRDASRQQPGTMAAIVGLAEDAVDEVCRASGAELCNYNSPTQMVAGGTLDAIERASHLAKERGGRSLPLPVSGAFHTSLMAPAAEEFAALVDGCPIEEPTIPVIANVTGEPLTAAGAVREELIRQITRPVLWHQSVTKMIASGVTTFIETGPGKVLSGMVKRAGPGLTALNLDGVDSLRALRDV